MKILIVKTSSLGDIIHAFPVLSYLTDHFSNVQIDWVVEKPFADLLSRHPAIHRFFYLNTKSWRQSPFAPSHLREITTFRRNLKQEVYDVVFDLQGNLKSGLVTFCAKSKTKVGFGLKSAAEWPNILFTHRHINPPSGQNIREDNLFLVKSFFDNHSPHLSTQHHSLLTTEEERKNVQQLISRRHPSLNFPILVCPGAHWKNKQLPQKALRDFLNLLCKKFPCYFFLLWGNEEECRVAEQLQTHFTSNSQVIPKLSFPTLQHLMAHMQLIISMDSLPLHLAGTTSTPTFSIFGPSSAAKYKPMGDQHFAFQGSCPYGKTFEKRCPILRTCSTGACIKALTGKQLFEAFESWWHKRTKWT